MSSIRHDTVIKVVIVEDHPLTRMGVKHALLDFDDIQLVAECDSVHSAIDASKKHAPDVVIMDIDLPDGSGIDAACEIRKLDESIRILIFAAQDEERLFMESLAAGASGYCVKGVLPDVLVLAVRSVHAGAIWLQSSIGDRVGQDYSRILTSERIEQCDSAKESLADPATLSERERQVLQLVVRGMTNREVARQLNISVATAKTHVRNILKRLGVSDRTKAAVKAVRLSLV